MRTILTQSAPAESRANSNSASKKDPFLWWNDDDDGDDGGGGVFKHSMGCHTAMFPVFQWLARSSSSILFPLWVFPVLFKTQCSSKNISESRETTTMTHTIHRSVLCRKGENCSFLSLKSSLAI
ncbi:hypothetical protein PoB_007548400 [Plakobranchus ocellatus]|uniref:Uncharacterized protein n=1 Tax=Plakobranchus ocellatus TaxID=259542 RepID=A0AAV4DY37_9GAST|nr:hypothetical protein PoB_007548400 [Plakobranchus ocellatus]